MEQLKHDLENCTTVAQMLNVVIGQFNLDIQLQAITKAMFITGLIQAVRMVNAKRK